MIHIQLIGAAISNQGWNRFPTKAWNVIFFSFSRLALIMSWHVFQCSEWKTFLEWLELEDSIHRECVEANFWLLKFIIISIQGIKLPKRNAIPVISIFLHDNFYVALHCSTTCTKLLKWSTMGGSTIQLLHAISKWNIFLVCWNPLSIATNI